MAAQRHELTLTQHYESLIMARETSLLQADLSSNSAVDNSIHRLGMNLRALLRNLAGEEGDPSEDPDAHLDAEGPGGDEGGQTPGDDELLEMLLGREDWALERESEVARLERENEALRRALGIDRASAETNGWLDDEARELAYRRPQFTSQRSGSPGPSPALGEAPRYQGPVFDSMPNQGPAGGGNGGAMAGNQVQRAAEMAQPGMRGAQGRRPAMFGRGRGNGTPYWDPGANHGSQTGERPWLAQVGMDLSR